MHVSELRFFLKSTYSMLNNKHLILSPIAFSIFLFSLSLSPHLTLYQRVSLVCVAETCCIFHCRRSVRVCRHAPKVCVYLQGGPTHFLSVHLETPASAFLFHLTVNVILPLCSSIEDASLPGERMCAFITTCSRSAMPRPFSSRVCVRARVRACVCVHCVPYSITRSRLWLWTVNSLTTSLLSFSFHFVFSHNCFSPSPATVCSEEVTHTHYIGPEHMQSNT